MKIKNDLSPNYSKKIRLKKNIKFVIIHYTGMQSEIESKKKLKNIESKVSCHYFINRKGLITQMVNDNKVAWHAGKSKWKTFKNLNEYSVGVELQNKGHEFGYQKFSKIQISNLIKLCKKLKKKYSLKRENFLGHSDIAPLRKIDPGEKFPWKKLNQHNIGNWFSNNQKSIKFSGGAKTDKIFFKNLFKIGYRYFKVDNRDKKKDKLIIKSFQQHYLPKNVSGKIDRKTLRISYFLANYPK
ncbi:N-acetylmuramoyl-L-alanine amidase [Pelagibacteraceae bacterium]|jgi:N-acetylmuramoyl-L-alanine amidase|nr:N-acetylmuramoyl-L-alanine amidase [Pelagibacteraceae bacterium]